MWCRWQHSNTGWMNAYCACSVHRACMQRCSFILYLLLNFSSHSENHSWLCSFGRKACFCGEVEEDGPNPFTCLHWGSYPGWCFQIQWGIDRICVGCRDWWTHFSVQQSLWKTSALFPGVATLIIETPDQFRLSAVRSVWDIWVDRFPLLYNPGPSVSVDEQLMPFRGRCPFKQYITSKPN